jgi:hypothetical protein
MLNRELAAKVRDQIADHPETHNQRWWIRRIAQDVGDYCQTTACAAGWAVLLGDPTATPVFRGRESTSVILPDGTGRGYSEYAAELLGIDRDMRFYLFGENRTVDEVLDVLNTIVDGGTPEVPDLGNTWDDLDDDLDDEDPFPEVDADWGIPEVEHQGAMD